MIRSKFNQRMAMSAPLHHNIPRLDYQRNRVENRWFNNVCIQSDAATVLVLRIRPCVVFNGGGAA